MRQVSRRKFLTMAAIGVPLAATGAAPAQARAEADRGHITGLLAREYDKVTPEGRDRLTGFVQRLEWSKAQPTPGGAISDDALDLLEAAVARARDEAYGYPRLKLRLVAGAAAPGWARELGGGHLDWTDPDDLLDEDGKPKTKPVPRWWSTEYLDAYQAFVAELAGHLDDRIWAEVTVSATCTLFAEPCVHQFGVKANRQVALAAEYTAALDEAALKRAILDQHTILKERGIASSVAYNPFQTIVATEDGTGTEVVNDNPMTKRIMNYQRNKAGTLGIWENNSLIAKWRNGTDGPTDQARTEYKILYDHMVEGAAAGHPVQFQTATLAKIIEAGGTPRATASWVADIGGLSVELPQGWEDHDDGPDEDQADDLNARMAANNPPEHQRLLSTSRS